jgi:hypothetical protein
MVIGIRVRPYEQPFAARCSYCEMTQVLSWQIVYFDQWQVFACYLCARTIDRNARWLAEARKRYHQNRSERRTAGPDAPT